MSKIIYFSDLHIHCHKQSLQRLQDCLDVLRWVFQTARDRGISDIIFLGDLFHDRQKIQVIVYQGTFDIFWEYRDLNVYLLLGNHDLWFYDRWDVSSVAPLMALRNVEVINKPCTQKIGGLDMDFLPFTHDPVSAINLFPKKSPVLCSHVAVDDATLNQFYNTKSDVSIESEKDVVRVTKDIFRGWERTFLGHYHCAQRLDDRVEYIGSPLELSFNEAFQQKHIGILDTDTLECEYVVNQFSPKHLILKYDDVGIYNLDDNFVQIQVEDIESSEILEMRQNIISSSKPQSLEFKELKKKDIKKDHCELQTKFDIANGDIMERYVSAVGVGGLDRTKLLKIGKDICGEN